MKGILVPVASTTQLSNNNNYKIEDANHLIINKPPTKDHPNYSLLLDCLKFCMKVNQNLEFGCSRDLTHILNHNT
jgi:hypothetical protein